MPDLGVLLDIRGGKTVFITARIVGNLMPRPESCLGGRKTKAVRGNKISGKV